MDPTAIISLVLSAVETLVKVEPQIMQTITDLKPYAHALYLEWTGQQPTDDQRATMSAGIDALFARLEAPLPAAQPGDPDYVAPGTGG